ncbi:MAG: NUDIX domain-containing protein [Candidatus Latescibacterota bacterium]
MTASCAEQIEIVDEQGRVIGRALRSECHGNPALIHRTVHVLVFNTAGELLLQKRGEDKDIQPGKWDTSVGGHLDIGEDYEEAAYREMGEEVGIRNTPLVPLYAYPMRNTIESEDVRTYRCTYDGPITPDPGEISEARFWTTKEIEGALGRGCFTPNFEEELARYKDRRREDRQV